ncbi:PepSY domain-containing protein [Roseibium marinum]|uniref:YpeB-like protein with putative protease inhibitory function n=1 Tax=Roseibium marinum TaxID=281252 RepID=A0A2S3V2R2_9HYPH|nr:PepSY domain-containing protein [Roseibium marinum]POF34261.1 YpeB-like protein with putative protease inhibitory function [Roseibium marinum]
MRKFIFLATLLSATSAFASGDVPAELKVGTGLGTSLQQVTETLTSQGYEVRKSEMEDGKIEVYFVKGTAKGEIYVDAQTGKVTKVDMK